MMCIKTRVYYVYLLIMEFFDFYKLLELPVGTPIEDIKKAYILKLHYFSEAYQQGDEKAAEYVRIITSGFQLLSDPEKKRVYDLMLLNIYLKQGNSDLNRSLYRKYGSSERNPVLGESETAAETKEKREMHMAPEDPEVTKKRVRGELIQVAVASALVPVLLILFDTIFWQPYTALKMIGFVLLAVGYALLMLWIVLKIHRYYEVKALIYPNESNPEKIILTVFLIMFFAIPVLSLRVENLRKIYQLQHYAVKTRARTFMLEDNWLTVWYVANGKEYQQSVLMGENAENFKKNFYDTSKFFVRYSSQSPKIISIETGP